MESSFGVIGLGVMGAAYVRNLASRGVSVSAWSLQGSELDKMKAFGLNSLRLFSSLEEFVNSLTAPRKILMLITAGNPVDQVIASLEGLLSPGDVLIDGGNEWYENTLRRFARCKENGIHYCAMGVSGGEFGALLSPCLMFSGHPGDYDLVKPIIEQHDGRSFYIGPDASGHYVKMVHNGIEYAIMQILSEIYMIMRSIMELNVKSISKIFQEWNETEAASFLLGITANILPVKADDGEEYLLDKIMDSSGANGTGKWTVKEALDLGIPVPTITAAVEMRNASNGLRDTTLVPKNRVTDGTSLCEGDLKRTLLVCMIVSFAQGTALLMEASKKFNWNLDLHNICKIWSSDAIISCSLLTDIGEAFLREESTVHLLKDPDMQRMVQDSLESWTNVSRTCLKYNVAAPAIVASLQYVQTMSSLQLGHNLIQAQRDYFGSHCFTRVDLPGKHHHNWRE
ncbi:6-phosphogluconate dehydrogenase [Babesia gibsoni]|uniref:6-phosphogluconate dehydrogenase, decarboxylating n=1 Tax=Babesia gibsoni TaxID=33632 RepID=A0AAD8LGI0_BABGI|nr:6-phosphogluconate dehydrogenase [Babesia gibsoni]